MNSDISGCQFGSGNGIRTGACMEIFRSIKYVAAKLRGQERRGLGLCKAVGAPIDPLHAQGNLCPG